MANNFKTWLNKNVFGELLLAVRADVVLVPKFLENFFVQNNLAFFKGIEFTPKVKNIKFLTKYLRAAGGEEANKELNQLVKTHNIPKFAFQIVDLAPNDTVEEVKQYLFDTYQADQGPSRNEFLKEFTEQERKDQSEKETKQKAQDEAGKEWRYMGGDPKEQEFVDDVEKMFDGKGNMKPVTCKIKTKSGKEIQMTMRVINGEMAAKIWDELKNKYGEEFLKEHVRILDGKQLKEVLEKELGEPIESIEFAGGELDPTQFTKAPKFDQKKLDSKLQDMVQQFKQDQQDQKEQGKDDKKVELKKSVFNPDDPELKEMMQHLENQSKFN